MAPTLTCVTVGLREELAAGVQVGEGPDPQTVGGVELGAQEVTAGLLHLAQLQQARSGKQGLGSHPYVQTDRQTHVIKGTPRGFLHEAECLSLVAV